MPEHRAVERSGGAKIANRLRMSVTDHLESKSDAYLATLLGAKDEDVLRYFILVVALLLDPAATFLLLAATRKRS